MHIQVGSNMTGTEQLVTFCSLITLATPRQDWTGSNPSRREGGGCGFTLSRSHSCCAMRLFYTQISPGHIWITLYFSCKTRRKGAVGDIDVVWKIILKCVGSLRRCCVDYTKLASESTEKVYCEHGNEELGSIKCGEFLGHPGEHHLLKTEFSPHCWLMSVTLSTTDKYQCVNVNN